MAPADIAPCDDIWPPSDMEPCAMALEGVAPLGIESCEAMAPDDMLPEPPELMWSSDCAKLAALSARLAATATDKAVRLAFI
jgi:hypothetical protein